MNLFDQFGMQAMDSLKERIAKGKKDAGYGVTMHTLYEPVKKEENRQDYISKKIDINPDIYKRVENALFYRREYLQPLLEKFLTMWVESAEKENGGKFPDKGLGKVAPTEPILKNPDYTPQYLADQGFLNTTEVCKMLNVSRNWILRKAKEGYIEHTIIGRKRYFKKEDIEEFIQPLI